MSATWRLLPVVAIGFLVIHGPSSAQTASPSSQPSPQTRPAGPAPAPSTSPSQPHGHAPRKPSGKTSEGESSAPINRPPIQFQPTAMDLGTIRPGKPASGSVRITNVSAKPIMIESIKASCTCTTIDLAATRLEPGQSVNMPATYKGSTEMGVHSVVIRVQVSGYDVVELPVNVLVALPVRAEPAKINAMRDPNTGFQPQSGSFTVVSEDGKPFHILSVQGKPPPFLDFDPAKDDARNHYKLRWDLTKYSLETCADSNGVMMPGWLVLLTDHPDCPVLDVEIRHQCTVVGHLKADDHWLIPERRMFIGQVKPGVPSEMVIEARWLPKAEHVDEIKMVTSESPEFDASLLSIEKTPEGFKAHLQITPKAGRQGAIYGEIRCHSERQQWPLFITGSAKD